MFLYTRTLYTASELAIRHSSTAGPASPATFVNLLTGISQMQFHDGLNSQNVRVINQRGISTYLCRK
jgi:hypothetical protein